jgi:hypothetical protein
MLANSRTTSPTRLPPSADDFAAPSVGGGGVATRMLMAISTSPFRTFRGCTALAVVAGTTAAVPADAAADVPPGGGSVPVPESGSPPDPLLLHVGDGLAHLPFPSSNALSARGVEDRSGNGAAQEPRVRLRSRRGGAGTLGARRARSRLWRLVVGARNRRPGSKRERPCLLLLGRGMLSACQRSLQLLRFKAPRILLERVTCSASWSILGAVSRPVLNDGALSNACGQAARRRRAHQPGSYPHRPRTS